MTENYHDFGVVYRMGRTIILTLIYFFYLYSFQIPGLSIGSVLPCLAFFSMYSAFSLLKGRRFVKLNTTRMLRQYLFWNIFLLIYVFLLLQLNGEGNGTTPLKDYIYMLIILPIIYISGNFIFSNLEELMKILYFGVIIQSGIILAALLIPALSLALFLLLPEGAYNSDTFGGFDMITQRGYHIGLGVFTSAGSVKMAIGQIGACYYLFKNRGLKFFLHLVIFILITIATTVVSKTGLLISIVGFLVVFYVKGKQGFNRALKFAFLIFASLVIGYFALVKIMPSDFFEDTFKRVFLFAEYGAKDTYFSGYAGESGDNVIPPITTETIMGLGITYGTSGSGITTITDGGFLRNYSAMGLIVAVINYLIIILYFKKQLSFCRNCEYKSGLILYMFIVFLIGEFKEYYIYYISPMCFFFLIFSMIERTNKQIVLHCSNNC